ncbi:MAG: tRNA (adenosine(37)-N6)-dimethylallyltransferase MiaA [Deltaproteobacteria bacterium]|nr:tRNA (adenosine(37)-N6)-dimethylallyltransferase MiaA [Deltaproteobacteria bacterium]
MTVGTGTDAAAPRVVAVVGPTASGKSALSLRLAAELDGEILSCDSMQVYRGLDIGTAKPSAAERSRVPHHLLDVADPDEDFSAARFAELADVAAADVASRGRVVVACGGTGLYLRAWLRGLFPAPRSDPAIRARHREEGAAAVRARLQDVDPAAAAAILPGDLKRLSRALEVFEQTGVPITELRRRAARGLRYPVRLVGLSPPRPLLHERVDARFDAMMAAGLVDEVRGLISRHGPDIRPLGALGYAQLRAHLQGLLPLDEAVRQAKRDTRRYARRQLTWFRAEPDVAWHEDPDALDLEPLRRFCGRGG